MNPFAEERERLRREIEALRVRQAELPTGTDPAALVARYSLDAEADRLKDRLHQIRDW